MIIFTIKVTTLTITTKKDLIQLYRFIDLIPREVTDKYKKWFNVGGGGGYVGVSSIPKTIIVVRWGIAIIITIAIEWRESPNNWISS